MIYKMIRLLLLPFFYIFYRPRIIGMDNFPTLGKAIVYSNHTSLIDPVILGCIMPRKIHFMAKQELFKYPIIRTFMKGLGAFPVKRGKADISAIKNSLKLLQDDKLFGIFPEGTRSKTGAVQTFSHGIASIAHKSKAPTVPIVILNGYKLFRPIRIIVGKPLNFDEYYNQRINTQTLEIISMEMQDALKQLMVKY